MADAEMDTQRGEARSAPEVVAPANKVNVALPFGNIHIEESSKDLAELATIVADLALITEGLKPGPKGKKLHDEAEALAARLH